MNQLTTISSQEQELVKQLGLTKADPHEITHFFAVAKQLQLDPLSKQIYAIPRGGKLTIMTSIDGARSIASRTKEYAGVDIPDFNVDENGKPISCTMTVYRIVQGVRCGFSHIAYFSEYNTGQNLWVSKPLTMLAKVAEMGALRKAFPAEFSKIYETAEINHDTAADVVGTVTDFQANILLALTMLLSPKQDRATAWNRVNKIPKTDYEDYKIMGLDALIEKGIIGENVRHKTDEELQQCFAEVEK